MVSTEGGAFHLEDITFCGGVCFVLKEGVLLIWSRGSHIQRNNCMCCNLYIYKMPGELIAKYPRFIEIIIQHLCMTRDTIEGPGDEARDTSNTSTSVQNHATSFPA